jgi:hypothetical protein
MSRRFVILSLPPGTKVLLDGRQISRVQRPPTIRTDFILATKASDMHVQHNAASIDAPTCLSAARNQPLTPSGATLPNSDATTAKSFQSSAIHVDPKMPWRFLCGPTDFIFLIVTDPQLICTCVI